MSAADRIYYDERRRTVWYEGTEPTVIRAKSFAAFMALARAYPDAVSKDDLIRDVWDGAAVSDDSITQSIATIRRALGDKDHTFVQTLSGKGYTLMVPASVEPAEPAAPSIPKPEDRQRRPMFLLAGLAGVVLCLVAGVSFFLLGPNRAPQETLDQIDKPAMAVLEFAVLGDQSELQTFAYGLQSDLVIALSELDTVQVLAPSVLDGSEPGQTPLRAYAAHGARFVIGGTIQPKGGKLQISGHLVDTDTSQIAWVRTWDGDHANLPALQDRVVAALAGELANPWSGQITGLGSNLSAAGAPVSEGPQDLILQGAQRFEEFHGLALAEAEQLFRKALEINANDATAWAGLSFVLGAMLPLVPADEAEALRSARANAGRQAYHLGNGSGRSLVAGSWTAALRGNRSETLRRLREGADALTSDADGLAMAALQAALTTDLYAEAIEWGDHALALRDNPPGWYALGPAFAHVFLEDYEKAADYLGRAPDGYAPAMALLAGVQQHTGDIQGSIESAARLRMLSNAFSVEQYLGAELLFPEDKRDVLRALFSETTIRMQ